MTDHIVIVGTGLAGYNLAREIRKLDKDCQLTLITSDDGTFYSKPMLSNALAKGKQASELGMSDAQKMRDDLDATILTTTTVIAIQPEGKSVVLKNADPVSYDKLVLALGATPVQFPIDGDGADDVLVVNNLQDYGRFRDRLADKQRVAIIGPGLIGCEFANDLCSQKIQVDVIGPDTSPLGRLLPEQAGKVLQQKLSDLGVHWHLETVVTKIDRDGDQYQLQLKNGETVTADLILSAIGLRANTQLAKDANIKTERGICTDEFLQTSDADAYALGDCAEVQGHFLPFVMPLMNAARALAATLTGNKTAVSYPAMPVLVKTPAYPIVIAPPAMGAEGQWQIEQTDDAVNAQFKFGDNLLGFALSGKAVSEKMALTKQLPSVL